MMQWFDYYFGTAPPADAKITDKKKTDSSTEDDCTSCCCKAKSTPHSSDSSATAAPDTSVHFQTSNKLVLPGAEDDSLFAALIASEHITCVKFTASWCKPCQQQEPEIARLAANMAESGSLMRFVSVDVDLHDDLFSSLEIVGIPHIRLYRRGEVLESFTGGSIAGLQRACEELGKKNK